MRISCSLEKAKSNGWYHTDVINEFKEGTITEIQKNMGNRLRATYLIEANSKKYVLKTLSCPSNDNEYINQANEEYDFSFNYYQYTDGIAKPLRAERLNDESSSRFIIEILYEYCGEDLKSLLGKLEPEKIVEYMGQIAGTMATLHSNHVFHCDLKLANFAVFNEKVKLIDFGVYKTRTFTCKPLKGGTSLYLPQDANESGIGNPGSIDVYCWGILFYQMLTGMDSNGLRTEIDLRNKDYPKFIKNIENIKVGCNEKLTNTIAEILVQALDNDYINRPTFAEIEVKMSRNEVYKKKLKELENKKDELLKIQEELGMKESKVTKLKEDNEDKKNQEYIVNELTEKVRAYQNSLNMAENDIQRLTKERGRIILFLDELQKENKSIKEEREVSDYIDFLDFKFSR